jgi:hypothetical protein
VIGIDGNLAPRPWLEALSSAGVLDDPACRLVAKEDHRHTGGGLRTESVGNGKQQAGAVARDPVGCDRAAVTNAAKPFDERVDDRP